MATLNTIPLKEWTDDSGKIHRGPPPQCGGRTPSPVDSNFDVIDCRSCGFRHIIPVPPPDQLRKLYREDYYQSDKPYFLQRQQEDLEWWDVVYSERYDTFEELLPPQRRKVLDVGSGFGHFLQHGQGRGWQATGLEPSRAAARHCRQKGLEIVEDFLTPKATGELAGPFDVVHLNEVLEHVADPAGILTLARQLLNPGGLICVVVPNDYNPFQLAACQVENHSPWWVTPPHHINYFTFDSLSGLLERCGFEEIAREGTFPIDLFLLMGDSYIGDDDVGRQCHARRKRLEINLDRAGFRPKKRQLYRTLAQFQLGREAVLYGRVVSGAGRGSDQ